MAGQHRRPILSSSQSGLTAIEMAISDSVTVSIGEETSGDLRDIFLVSAEVRSCQQGHSGHSGQSGQMWVAESRRSRQDKT